MKLKKNDTVLVLRGRDRGKQGVVKECLPDKSRVIVEGVNLVKKHTKPQGMRDLSGKHSLTTPCLPLSRPLSTNTVSFFLSFILNHLRSKRNNSREIFVS
jgi:ribosomal protein L24